MEERLVSVMLDKEKYDHVKKYCFDNGVKIKEFIMSAINTELNKRGVCYVKFIRKGGISVK